MRTVFYALLAILALTLPAEAVERRIALVVGNANYQTGSLPTPANDAGLVAQTLQAAAFDVTGARDLARNPCDVHLGIFWTNHRRPAQIQSLTSISRDMGCSWRARTISFPSMLELQATQVYRPKL
jgi:hypothetical protein